MLNMFFDIQSTMRRWPYFIASSIVLAVELSIMYLIGSFDDLLSRRYIVSWSDWTLGLISFFMFAPISLRRLNDLRMSHDNYWKIAGATVLIGFILGLVERLFPGSRLLTIAEIFYWISFGVSGIFGMMLTFKKGAD